MVCEKLGVCFGAATANLPCGEGREMTMPGAALPGFCVLRSESMKMKWSGSATQINCVLYAARLTLVLLPVRTAFQTLTAA